MTKFSVICCDPPWSFDDKLKKMKPGKTGSRVKRGAESNYQVMNLADLISLPVKEIVEPKGTVLLLWVPSTLLKSGITLAESWGFTVKGTFVWVKTKKNKKSNDLNDQLSFGMGRLFRQCHEIALVCTLGKNVYKSLVNRSQRSVTLDQNDGHSTKPDTLQERLETMFPNADKLEMFARRSRQGWTCLGNEIDGRDIRDSLVSLVDDIEEKETTDEIQIS